MTIPACPCRPNEPADPRCDEACFYQCMSRLWNVVEEAEEAVDVKIKCGGSAGHLQQLHDAIGRLRN